MLDDCLDGVKVLDFSHVVAGPLCGMLLADMGADVTKIEAPQGELGRSIGPPWQNGESVAFLSVNRNKHGMAIDLKKRGAAAVVLRMMRHADIVVESFRPGVMASLGLGYETARQVNPALVYCSISAYGQTGPMRDKPGVDGIIQAVAGLMSTLGTEGAAPCKVPVPVADMATGYLATIAILGALRKRERLGIGQHLDVSLYNSTVMLQQIGMAFYLASGEVPQKTGSAAPYAAPNEALPTADGWIMVAAYQPPRWRSLCRVLGQPGLETDPRFHDNSSRVRNRQELAGILGDVLRQRPTGYWEALLSEADILCAPIAGYAEVVASAQYQHNRIETVTEHPVAGMVKMPGFAIGIPQGGARVDRAAPMIGQHSDSVLLEYGFSSDEIADLIVQGILRPAMPDPVSLPCASIAPLTFD